MHTRLICVAVYSLTDLWRKLACMCVYVCVRVCACEVEVIVNIRCLRIIYRVNAVVYAPSKSSSGSNELPGVCVGAY